MGEKKRVGEKAHVVGDSKSWVLSQIKENDLTLIRKAPRPIREAKYLDFHWQGRPTELETGGVVQSPDGSAWMEHRLAYRQMSFTCQIPANLFAFSNRRSILSP